MRILVFFSLLTWLTNLVDCKTVRGRVTLTKDEPIFYLGQFGCNIGECPMNFRFKFVDNKENRRLLSGSATKKEKPTANLGLRLFLDETWESYGGQKADLCSIVKKARSGKTFSLPLQTNQWSSWVENPVTQSVRPHVWYTTVEDCKGQMRKLVEDNSGRVANTIVLEYEAEFRQPSGSHFSYELLNTVKYTFFYMLVFLATGAFFFGKQLRELMRFGSVHILIQVLNFSFICQFNSLLLHLVHLVRYSTDGQGYPWIDFLSTLSLYLSQVSLASLLIFLAFGFSLKTPQTEGSKFAIPVILGVFVLHMLILIVDRIHYDDRYRFHSLDGTVGWVILVLRLVLYFAFMNALFSTKSLEGTPGAVKHFLNSLLLPSTVYFMAFPGIWVITWFFAPYLQHTVITTGLFFVQILSFWWISSLLLLRGEYFEVSYNRRSLLPGGIGGGGSKHSD